jgi:hypothetical protein
VRWLITPPIRAIGDYLSDDSVVFWVDETGQHGLVAQPYDAVNPDNSNPYMYWYKAKEVAENFGLGWRLPNKYELNLLYLQKDVVGGFAGYAYWSSTENDSGNAWVHDFTNGDQAGTGKTGSPGWVRAIRAFSINHLTICSLPRSRHRD